MPDNFLPSRGCIYAFTPDGADASGGLYDVPGLKDIGGDGSHVLITGVDIGLTDIILPVATTEKFNVIYSFGADFGQVQISGELLFGLVSDDKAAGLANGLIRWFEERRISNSKIPLSVSVGDSAYNVYITGLRLGEPIPELNIQPFMIIGLQTD